MVFRCPLWGVFGRFRFAVSLVSVGFSGFRSVSVWFFVGFGRGFGRFFVVAAGFGLFLVDGFSLFRLVLGGFSGFRLVLVIFFVGFGRGFGWFWSSFSLVSVGVGRLVRWSPSVSVVFFVGFVVGFGRLFR